MQATTPRRGEWTRLGLFFACNVLFAAGLFSHAFLYNFYLDHLALGEAVMGGAAAALTAGGLAALVPAGRLVDRVGGPAAWLTAAALTAAGLVAGALVRTPVPVHLAAFLSGAGTAMWRVSTGPLLMRLTHSASRARAFSWNVALLLASGAAWTALSGAAPAWLERVLDLPPGAGIRVGLIAGASGTALAALLFLPLRRAARVPVEPAPETRRSDAEKPAAAGPGLPAPGSRYGVPRGLLPIVLAIALFMTAGGFVIPFFNLYFQRVHELSVARTGLLLGSAQAVTALVVFASGDLAARLGPRRVLLVWAIAFAPLLWGLGVAGSLVMAATLFLLQGFVPPATNPLFDQVLLERAPAERWGIVSTWRNAATEGAGLLGASAGGALLELASFPVLFTVAGATALAGAAALIFALRGRAGPGRTG